MSEEEIIKIIKKELTFFRCTEDDIKFKDAIRGLIDLYNKEKEKNKKLEMNINKLNRENLELKKDKLELINKNHVVHFKDVEKELREMRNAIDTKNAEIECLNLIHEMVKENNYISKDKIKNIINQLEEEQEQNRKELARAIDYLSNEMIESASKKIEINMSIREYLLELLEERN